ncbi:uncharacterized protein KY384_008849 [Bacidia gigantensis]|uniref:uncharacterized protein n=1 Tax=Bacidia gigantensis TaxID=2732470 RepID=UPI001D03DCA6|nr:uncharacterized protein KY384_008849 [Bacidia gigantensis]KAG8525205.1 hypothetical protein KY384_008849 [Bacidia gigantensis]
MSTYQVTLYQLNAGLDTAGDSAIALLATKTTGATKPKIKSAILIDGGMGANVAVSMKTTIKEIKADYDIPGDREFKFDAVSLSHWDQDHILGLFFFLADKSLWEATTTKGEGQEWDPNDAAKPDATKPAKCFKYFKYDKDGNPLTRLYTQSWGLDSYNDGKPAQLVPKETKNPACQFHRNAASIVTEPHIVNVTCYDNPGDKTYKLREKVIWSYQRTDLLMGVDFFSGTPGYVAANRGWWELLTSPQMLIDANDLKGAPGLYVVRDVSSGSGDDDDLHDRGVRVVPKAGGTDTNKFSIVLMLIWKTTSGAPKLALYSGGDAEFKTEDLVANWLGAPKDDKVKEIVDIVKIGHHGSTSGTSRKFMEAARPGRCMISAGTQHGHPTQEIIMYLQAFYSAAGLIGNRVSALNYPYHLGWVNDDGNERPYHNALSRPEYLQSDTTEKNYKQFIAKMHALWESTYIGPRLDPIDKWTPELKAITKADIDNAKAAEKAANQAFTGMRVANTGYGAAKALTDSTKAKVKFEEKKYLLDKANVLAPYMRVMWDSISTVDRTVYPVRAFDGDDVLPSTLRIIDYLKITFYPLHTTDIVPMGAGKVYAEAFAADKAKTKKNKVVVNDAKSNRAVRGLDNKRKRAQRNEEPSSVFPVLSPANEENLIANQSTAEADDDPDLPPLDPDEPAPMDDDNQLRNLRSEAAPMAVTASSVVPATTYTSIYPADADPPSGALLVEADSNADYFVSGLLDGHLSISGGIPLPSKPSIWAYGVTADDNYSLWLQSFFGGASDNVQPSIRLNAADSSPSEVSLMVNKLGTLLIRPLTFSSTLQSLSTALSLTPTSTPNLAPEIAKVVDSTGFLQNSSGVILGLQMDDQSSSVDMTIGNVFAYLGLDVPFFLNSDAQLSFNFHDGAVNGLWIASTETMSTTHRMSLTGASKSAFLSVGNEFPGFSFTDWDVNTSKHAYMQTAALGDAPQDYIISNSDFCVHAKTVLDKVDADWDAYIGYGTESARIMLRFPDQGKDPVALLWPWMLAKLGLDAEGSWDSFNNARTALNSSFSFREVAITAIHDTSGWSFQSFSMVFELDLTWGIDTSTASADTRVPLRFSFLYKKNGTSPTIIFSGGLWPAVSVAKVVVDRLNPNADLYPLLMPIKKDPQYRISIKKLGGTSGQLTLPDWFPTDITNLNLALEYDGATNTSSISFRGTMSAPASTPHGLWSLDSVAIKASYSTTTAQTGTLNFSFDAKMLLRPRDYDIFTPIATILVDVQYGHTSNGSTWLIRGGATDLNVGNLYSLFAGPESDTVMDILQDIYIAGLVIEFFHSPTVTRLESTGEILIGDIELDLTFNYTWNSDKTTSYDFSATMSTDFSIDDQNLGDFLTGISSTLASLLPPFLTNISFAVLDDCSIELKCLKTKTLSTGKDVICFAIVAKVTDFEFSFVQLTEVYDPKNMSTADSTTKRLFKLTLEALPNIPMKDMPLLDNLTQPFDQIDLVWIGDDLTKEEVDLMNKEVYVDRHDRLIYKQSTSPGITIQETDTVIPAGCHFMIVAEQNNVPTPILDYNFSAPPPPRENVEDDDDDLKEIIPGGQGRETRYAFRDNTAIVSNANYGSAKGGWSKTFGPLTISAIGLGFATVSDENILSIHLDAAVKLGPIAGFVRGFTIGLKLVDMKRIGGITVSFSGLGLELDRPPVQLAGELLKVDHGYVGGVDIAIEPYSFIAGGGYYTLERVPAAFDSTFDAPITNALRHNQEFKSMFLFVEVDGPIAEFEVASLSGLTGGGGYNSQIKLPNIDNVTTFPFLVPGSSTGNTPFDILTKYLSNGWFTPADGPAWLAAGITVKAFQSIKLSAVVVLDLSTDITFGVYAHASADFPGDVTDPTKLFARVDMGLLAVLEPAKGTFRAEGQLTPASFVLSSDCHLTGGFALCYWFANSGHEGDWVFTIGGYHSAYKPPAWYPVPPRLGISWQFDNTISIRGEAFFAITPKCCMGGGKLSLTFQSGSLSAHLDAYADFLVNYRPFSFIADVGVNIDVAYTADLEFVTHTFHVHLGASLDLHGPPLAGVAHVDWSIISFDIHFGDANPKTVALDWDGFCALLRGVPAVTNDDKKDEITGQGLHAVAATGGLLGKNTDPAAMKASTGVETLQVNKSTFSLRFSTLFPITNIVFDGFAGSKTPTGVPPTYMKPMHIDHQSTVSSTVTITISPAASFNLAWIYKQVPTALWDEYQSNTDPSSGNPVSSLLNDPKSTLGQAMGLDLTVPPPTESTDFVYSNIALACSFPASQHNMPGTLDVPAGISSSQELDAVVNVSYPMTPVIPYAPRTVLGRITAPPLAKHDIVNNWIKWTGVEASAPLAKRLADLGSDAQSGFAPAWIKELQQTPTVPLPVLSAEASVKATMKDGTRFASFGGYRGTGAMLNRDWLDGGFIHGTD